MFFFYMKPGEKGRPSADAALFHIPHHNQQNFITNGIRGEGMNRPRSTKESNGDVGWGGEGMSLLMLA